MYIQLNIVKGIYRLVGKKAVICLLAFAIRCDNFAADF